MSYYNLVISGMTEIELFGPYSCPRDRLRDARINWKENLDRGQDAIFKLDVSSDGVPRVAAFTNVEIEDIDDV